MPDRVPCRRSFCQAEAVVWYVIEDRGRAVFNMVCLKHGLELCENVRPLQILDHGAMHNGVAVGYSRTPGLK